MMRIVAWIAGAVVALLLAVVLWLAFPGTPESGRGLAFEGFTPLPKGAHGGLLTALDYMTVSGDTLFVAGTLGGNVYQIALQQGRIPVESDVRVLDLGRAPHGIAIDPKTGLAFVSRSESNMVDVIDPKDDRVLKHVPVAKGADAIFAVPDFGLVYVASGEAKRATMIELAQQSVIGATALGGEPEFGAFDPQSKLFFQNLTDTNDVAAVDLKTRAVVGRWPIGGCASPTGMAIDDARRLLFIVCGKNSVLEVFSLATHRVLASASVGGGPDSVAYDPALRRVYATGLFGVLSEFDASDERHLVELARLSLHFGAHTLALDPKRHRLYAAYASLLIAPRLAVFATDGP